MALRAGERVWQRHRQGFEAAGTERRVSALDKHYRVAELAELWGLSATTITKLFGQEQGVLKLDSGCLEGDNRKRLSGSKRRYVTLSIPADVARRVHERLCHDALKPQLPRRDPLRVIHLRSGNRGVPRKPARVIPIGSSQEHADSERIA
jgi:hypothetical protein